MRKEGLILLFTLMLAVVFWPAGVSPVNAGPGEPVVLSEDPVTGRITVETDTIKGIWHYKTLSSESNNQSGGSLYELYYKPMDPNMSRNLVSFYRSSGWGDGRSTPVWAGIGGVGSTDAYATDTAPGASRDYHFQDLIADNNMGGTLESHSAQVDAGGNALLTFTYRVRNQTTGKEWYRVQKFWTIEPGGAIKLRVDWNILSTGYFSELATRSNWSYDVGWDRFNKFGRDWLDPNGQRYLLGSSGISTQTAECWDYLNRFHPDWFALTGSSVVPTMKMTSDNNGLGFTGSGSYLLGSRVWGTPAGPTEEQCTVRASFPQIGSHSLSWMAWWSGNPPNGSRYSRLQAGTTWSDSFVIELFPGSPGSGPDIQSVETRPISGGALISWTTDNDSDSVVEVSVEPDNPYSWFPASRDDTLVRDHQIVVEGLRPETEYSYRVKSTDGDGNLSVSGGYNVLTPPPADVNFTLREENAYWANLSNYMNRQLTVDFSLRNDGPHDVNSVTISGADANSRVSVKSTDFPIILGNMAVTATSRFTLQYVVPPGTNSFQTVIYGSATAPNGEVISFPNGAS